MFGEGFCVQCQVYLSFRHRINSFKSFNDSTFVNFQGFLIDYTKQCEFGYKKKEKLQINSSTKKKCISTVK